MCILKHPTKSSIQDAGVFQGGLYIEMMYSLWPSIRSLSKSLFK